MLLNTMDSSQFLTSYQQGQHSLISELGPHSLRPSGFSPALLVIHSHFSPTSKHGSISVLDALVSLSVSLSPYDWWIYPSIMALSTT